MPPRPLSDECRDDLRSRFPGARFSVGTARGRLDVLGSMGAESGGTVAQMSLPTEVAITLHQTPSPEPQINLHSDTITPPMGESEITISRASLFSSPTPNADWATGMIALLRSLCEREPTLREQLSTSHTTHLCIRSRLPLAGGQGSSTALLIALTRALEQFTGTQFPNDWLIDAITHAEAVAAHASPCVGTRLDVTTLLTVAPGRLLHYTTQPAQLVAQRPLPVDVRLLAFDTGVRVANVEQTQTELRIAAKMAHVIIETIYKDLGQTRTPLRGYLANTSPLLYRQYFRTLTPRRLRGQDFLRTYATAKSTVEQDPHAWDGFQPATFYRVRTAVDHLISENEYADQFLLAMEELADPQGLLQTDALERQRTLHRAGRLLLASHHSYRLRLELSCREADWLVDRLMVAGPERGVFGARITGCGGGGTVVALMDRSSSANDALLEVMDSYPTTTGLRLHVVDASVTH